MKRIQPVTLLRTRPPTSFLPYLHQAWPSAWQARLREPSHGVVVSTRIANAGLSFYDPFTGFPMLWNAAKGRLYSVGRDGKDDNGDPKLDVGVTVLGR